MVLGLRHVNLLNGLLGHAGPRRLLNNSNKIRDEKSRAFKKELKNVPSVSPDSTGGAEAQTETLFLTAANLHLQSLHKVALDAKQKCLMHISRAESNAIAFQQGLLEQAAKLFELKMRKGEWTLPEEYCSNCEHSATVVDCHRLFTQPVNSSEELISKALKRIAAPYSSDRSLGLLFLLFPPLDAAMNVERLALQYLASLGFRVLRIVLLFREVPTWASSGFGAVLVAMRTRSADEG